MASPWPVHQSRGGDRPEHLTEACRGRSTVFRLLQGCSFFDFYLTHSFCVETESCVRSFMPRVSTEDSMLPFKSLAFLSPVARVFLEATNDFPLKHRIS